MTIDLLLFSFSKHASELPKGVCRQLPPLCGPTQSTHAPGNVSLAFRVLHVPRSLSMSNQHTDDNPFEAVPLTTTGGGDLHNGGNTNGDTTKAAFEVSTPSRSSTTRGNNDNGKAPTFLSFLSNVFPGVERSTSSGTHTNQIPPDQGSVAARERELIRREARITREEEDLRRREAASQNHTTNPSSKPKNWPPFFKVLRYDPADFPPVNAPMMRIAHYTWCLAAIAYIWNAFVITCAIFAGVGGINASDWLVALTFAGAGVPLSRWGWYGALVSAARRTQRDVAQTAAYGRFFIHFGIHCLAVVFAMIAVPIIGTFCAGLLFILSAFSQNAFVGILGLVSFGLWSTTLVGSVMVGKQALEKFRDAGDGRVGS